MGAFQEVKEDTFERAHQGTIFLKEVSALPLARQAKLLRLLQEWLLIKAGGVPVTCAVIAATAHDLEGLAAQGRFRRDLLYRIGVVQLDLPPLRERPEDIALLTWHHCERKSREFGRMIQLAAATLRVLERYPWPGNVRALVEVMDGVLAEHDKPVTEPEDLPAMITAEAERHMLERALQQTQGNHTRAAQFMGMSRTRFYRKRKAHDLLAPDGAHPAPNGGTQSHDGPQHTSRRSSYAK